MEHSFDTVPCDAFWIACRGYFSGSEVHGPSWLFCKDGVIRDIRSSRPEDADGIVRDGEPSYFVPLLADTHVHFYMEPWPLDTAKRVQPGSKPLEEEVSDAVVRVHRALASGIGFLRDMGDPFGVNLAVKSRLAADDSPAPNCRPPARQCIAPKKYGRFLGVMRETVDDIKRSIDELIEDHDVDYIKLVTTGIVNFEQKTVRQSPQFTREELTDVVQYAHRRDRKVAAHCSGADGLDIAIDAASTLSNMRTSSPTSS